MADESVTQLAPEPIPAGEEAKYIDEKRLDRAERRNMRLSILARWLARVQRVSSYGVTAYAGIHFLAVGVAPLLGPGGVQDPVGAADNMLLVQRALFEPTLWAVGTVELTKLAVGAHVLSGIALRVVRCVKARRWLPFTRIAASGYLFDALAYIHILTSRQWPQAVGASDARSGFVTGLVQRFGWPAYAYFGVFMTASLYHMCLGMCQWQRWPRWKGQVAAAVLGCTWMVALVRMVHEPLATEDAMLLSQIY